MNSPFKFGNPLDKNLLENKIAAAITGGLNQASWISEQPPLRFYGSSASTCERRNVAAWHTSTSESMDAAGRLYTEIGKAIHALFDDALNKNGLLIAAEFKLPRWSKYFAGATFGGVIDHILLIDDELAVNDTKTCGKLPSMPKSLHVAQVQTYCLLSGIDKGFITYQSRNVRDWSKPGIAIKVFDVSPTENDLKRISFRIANAIAHHEANCLPPIPKHIVKSQHCNYCFFHDNCYKAVLPNWTRNGELHNIVPVEKVEPIREHALEIARNILEHREARFDELVKILVDKGALITDESKAKSIA